MPYVIILICLAITAIIFRIVYEKFINNKTFACPNCGHNFKKSWVQIVLSPIKRKGILDLVWKDEKEYLRCPKCKIKDNCRIK